MTDTRRIRAILDGLDPAELAGWFCAGLEQSCAGGSAAAWRARHELRAMERAEEAQGDGTRLPK